MLDVNAPEPQQQYFSRYQLAQNPLPMMNHSAVYLPATMGPLPEKDIPNFDLGYYLSDDESEPVDYSIKVVKEDFVCPTKLARKYKVLRSEDGMKNLAQKSFSSKTVKKLIWIVYMYTQWKMQ